MSGYTNNNQQIVSAFFNGNNISVGYINNKIVFENRFRILKIHSILSSSRIDIKYDNVLLSNYDDLTATVPVNTLVEYTVTKECYPIEKKTINITQDTYIEVDLSTIDTVKTYNITYDENAFTVKLLDNSLIIEDTTNSIVNIPSNFIITEG